MIKSAPTTQNAPSVTCTAGGYKLIIAYFPAEVKGASLFVHELCSCGSVGGTNLVFSSFIQVFFDFFHTFSHEPMLNRHQFQHSNSNAYRQAQGQSLCFSEEQNNRRTIASIYSSGSTAVTDCYCNITRAVTIDKRVGLIIPH